MIIKKNLSKSNYECATESRKLNFDPFLPLPLWRLQLFALNIKNYKFNPCTSIPSSFEGSISAHSFLIATIPLRKSSEHENFASFHFVSFNCASSSATSKRAILKLELLRWLIDRNYLWHLAIVGNPWDSLPRFFSVDYRKNCLAN